MTNHERYQRAFSALHASEAQWTEEPNMKTTRKRYLPKALAICAVVALVLALAGITYAANVGGIQRTVQLWFHGDQTDAVLDIQDGSYTVSYEDENGESHEQSGGGVAFDMFGRERPVTEEEILEQLDMPEVEYEDSGKIMVYYHSQSIDITDKFDDDGICYVQLKDGDKTLYLTVKYQNGYCISETRFPSPWEFN